MGCWELFQAKLGGWYLLDWADWVAIGVHETQTYQRHILARRDDDAALAVVDDDVGAVGLGEAWCALEEFFSVHISEDGVNYRS